MIESSVIGACDETRLISEDRVVRLPDSTDNQKAVAWSFYRDNINEEFAAKRNFGSATAGKNPQSAIGVSKLFSKAGNEIASLLAIAGEVI